MPKQLISASVSAPGFLGLNTQRKADILNYQWATKADNCVIDDSGRMAARKGYRRNNTTAITASPDVKSIHEYVDASGSTLLICAAGNAVYKSVTTTMTDITGTATTPTADNWKFQNFNGKCVGFQASHAPIVISTVGGSFADITLSGTQQPSTAANEFLAAFGRLWCLDGTDLKYSDALDETAWNGVFDLTTVFLNGMDEPTGLAEFNGHLIVFGKRTITVWNNPWSPSGGGTLDTSGMTLVENIGGVGCIARDSIQHIGTDIIFLSSQGIRSLGRTIQEKSMPVNDLSKNINDELNVLINTEVKADIKSGYNKLEGFYLISLPLSGVCYYFDLRSQLQDGSYRVAKWTTSFTAIASDVADNLYFGTAGYVSKYRDYLDAVLADGTGGNSYSIDYESGWNDLSSENQQVQGYIKLPKKISVRLLGGAGQTLNVKWAFDYEDSFNSFSKTLSSDDQAKYNVAEYNIGEYSGGFIFNKVNAPMSRSGQFLKFGISITINGGTVAIQQVDMYSKLGRMV